MIKNLIRLILISLLFYNTFANDKAEFHVHENRTFLVVKSRVDQKFFLLVGPDQGVFEVELVDRNKSQIELSLRILRILGKKVDFNNDGKKEGKEIVGKIVKVRKSSMKPILEMDQTMGIQN